MGKKKPGSLPKIEEPSRKTRQRFLGSSMQSGSDGAGAVRRRWLPGSELAWPAKRERAPYGSEPTCTDGKKKSALTQRPSPTKKTRRKKSPAATYFRATKALSSAQESLTSVFGMGTGIASPPWPPDNNNQIITSNNEGKKREDKGRQKRPDRRREAPFPRGRRNMAKPRGLLVPLGCARRRACACGLSTRYCPGGLRWGRAPWDVSS